MEILSSEFDRASLLKTIGVSFLTSQKPAVIFLLSFFAENDNHFLETFFGLDVSTGYPKDSPLPSVALKLRNWLPIRNEVNFL